MAVGKEGGRGAVKKGQVIGLKKRQLKEALKRQLQTGVRGLKLKEALKRKLQVEHACAEVFLIKTQIA
jgi:hypothetical protein